MFEILPIAHAGVISDATPISQVIMNVLQFLLSMFGTLAIIMLVVSAIIYATSGGDEQRIKLGKSAMQYAVLGIIAVSAGYAVIMTFGKFFG